jgi:hypothetical protein
MKRNNLCEWNPLYKRPVFFDEEAGNCDNPIKWGVGFSRAEWMLCDKCVKLPVFKRFKFRTKIEPKPILVKDDFEL